MFNNHHTITNKLSDCIIRNAFLSLLSNDNHNQRKNNKRKRNYHHKENIFEINKYAKLDAEGRALDIAKAQLEIKKLNILLEEKLYQSDAIFERCFSCI